MGLILLCILVSDAKLLSNDLEFFEILQNLQCCSRYRMVEINVYCTKCDHFLYETHLSELVTLLRKLLFIFFFYF